MEKKEDMIDFCRPIIANSMIYKNAPIVKAKLSSFGPSQPKLNQASLDIPVNLDAARNNLDLLIESRAHATIEQND